VHAGIGQQRAITRVVVQESDPIHAEAAQDVGGVFLLYLAVTTAVGARRASLPNAQGVSARGGLLTGLLARALGPHLYLFWFLVGGPALVQAGEQGWQSVAAFLFGYYATIVGSNVGLALALHRWMTLFSRRVYRGILFAASLILAAYGLLLLGRRTTP
jgi:threonine/homoserine/homoserine lactone efflux protein